MVERIRDWGMIPGNMRPGKNNSICDVPGVRVGHYTVHEGRHHTGLTVILPRDNIYYHRCVAACQVFNGFGKTTGLTQIEELGQLETPIALTNTLNVGLVYDALVDYTAEECKKNCDMLKSVNPVVGECNDAVLNHIRSRIIGREEVMKAIRGADEHTEEGCIGAGAGMICHGLKGGIGTASRIIEIDDTQYTLGMLALCNHGMLEELNILGNRPGKQIREQLDRMMKEEDSGSCILVLATDLPLSSRQLKRTARRSFAGLARCGSYFGHGSGDIAIAFTTAYDLDRKEEKSILELPVLREDLINQAFAAAAECAEECVLNCLCAAHTVDDCHCLSEFRELIQKSDTY